MLYWYVLFVGTGREKAIERKINIALGSVLLVPIIPLCEEKFIKKGIAKFQKRPVFPGYVFIESSLESMVFREHIKSFIIENHEVYRLCCYAKLHPEILYRSVLQIQRSEELLRNKLLFAIQRKKSLDSYTWKYSLKELIDEISIYCDHTLKMLKELKG